MINIEIGVAPREIAQLAISTDLMTHQASFIEGVF